MGAKPLPDQGGRFVVEPDDQDPEVLHVVDGPVTVCTCWQEPGFAYDIARLLNSDAEPASDERQAQDGE